MTIRFSAPALAIAALLLAFAAPAHADRIVLSTGHVDAVAPRYEDGSLQLYVKDDTGAEPVLRRPDDVLFHVKPQAAFDVPAGLPESFAFLGPAGSRIFMLPQVQDADLLWPGWSSETIPAGVFKDDELRWILNRVTGPGPVQLYSTGTFGAPSLIFDSADGVPDVSHRPINTHAHFNWVFHEPGVYTIDFGVEGSYPDDRFTAVYGRYRFFVGDLADLPPEIVFVDGLADAYDPGESVELTARQTPASRFAAYRWERTCGETTEVVGSGATYQFTAAPALDACRIAVVLLDDAGHELLRSDERLLTVRPGDWGPRRIISQGHVDVLNVALADGALHVDLKDDSVEPTAYRRPQDTLLHAKPQAAFQISEDLPPEYGFLGALGDTVWMLPEVQQPDILWPGWETYGVPAGALSGDAMTWRLTAVDGPGAVALFTTDVFGGPRVLFDSGDGLPDASTMAASTHVHANWSFTKPGLYKLRFELSGEVAASGATVASGPVEYWFYVGDLAALPPYPSDDVTPDPTPTPTATATPTPDIQAQVSPTPTPAPAPAPPATPAETKPKRPVPSLRLTSASLRGRVLTLRTRFGVRSRVSVAVRRGSRTVARAKTRQVPATTKRLRVQLNRRLARGSYSVRVTARAGERSLTRTIRLRVR